MNFITIFGKELRSYFVSPVFYVVLTIFSALSGYFIYTDLALYNNWTNAQGFGNPVEGFFYYYFNDLRFILMILVPLITMRLFAEEKRTGTFELLTSYPVKNSEILAGKYLACMTILILMLAVTLINFLFIGYLWGFFILPAMITGYLGLLLLACSLISCGILISSLTENQAVAAMVTFGVFILFWFLTWNEMMAGEHVIKLLNRFSLYDRIDYLFKGVIDSKDVIFFLLFILFSLCLTLIYLNARNSWKSEGKWLRGRQIAKILLVLGIVVFLEIISFRHNVRIDLTPAKSYSLAGQTVKILKRLNNDINFTIFYKQDQRQKLEEFFNKLSLYTSHVKYKLIDLNSNPAQAGLYNITYSGQTVVEIGDKKDSISYPTEERVVSLIIKYLNKEKRRFIFTVGHGENSLNTEYSYLKNALQVEDWQVEEINISGEETIPAKDSLLLIAGPKADFSAKEIEQLNGFIKQGGKLILMIEPFVKLPKLEAFLENYRIGLGNGIIADDESTLMGGDILAPLIPHFAEGFVADSLAYPAIFPTARPLEIKARGKNFISILAKSSEQSWIIKDKINPGQGEIHFRDGIDLKGSVPVALIAMIPNTINNGTNTIGKILCFGDADFVKNRFWEMMANKDLFLNTANLLGGELDLISTRAQKYEFPYHYLTKKQGYLIFWLLVVAIPLISVVAGSGAYIYRRWRG